MEFSKLKEEIRSVELDATRADSDKYFEVVVKKSALAGMVGVLEGIFGPPAWPSSNKLSRETEKAVSSFGGLRSGQTLYSLSGEGFSIFAMLWPWQDGERITVKIAKT